MPEAHPTPPRTVLAFDFGLRRIGVAAGDTLTCIAAPRATVTARDGEPDWTALARHIVEVRPALLVVGTPYNADGTKGSLAVAAGRFAAELRARFTLPVETVDERWSSLEAQERLRDRRAAGARGRRVRREDVDSAAAAVILERWLAGEHEKK
jgi:putative Holliday junction resolvase